MAVVNVELSEYDALREKYKKPSLLNKIFNW